MTIYLLIVVCMLLIYMLIGEMRMADCVIEIYNLVYEMKHGKKWDEYNEQVDKEELGNWEE